MFNIIASVILILAVLTVHIYDVQAPEGVADHPASDGVTEQPSTTTIGKVVGCGAETVSSIGWIMNFNHRQGIVCTMYYIRLAATFIPKVISQRLQQTQFHASDSHTSSVMLELK